MKTELLAYFAGYFDGEGCIRLNRNTATLEITNTFPNTLMMFQERFGGSIRKRRELKTSRTLWHYELYGRNVWWALLKLTPHLREKQQQAKVLLQWFNVTQGSKQDLELRAELKRLKRIDYKAQPKKHKDYSQQTLKVLTSP